MAETILLVTDFRSAAPWLLVILALTIIAFIFHRMKLRQVIHQRHASEEKVLELETLLLHSKENEKRSKDETLAKEKLYKELLGTLNHEVRNPLNGVTGMSTLLEETSLSEEQGGYVQSIRSCSAALVAALQKIFKSAGISTDDKPASAKKSVKTSAHSVKLSVDFAAHYPLRILVAEDDPMNQQLALMILQKLGYAADIAPDGKEVLEIISEKNYDLILMDVQMPNMDGLEATRMIRLCLSSQPVIIAMTANAMEGDEEACMASGMDDYISKPVNMSELMEKLEKWATTVKAKG